MPVASRIKRFVESSAWRTLHATLLFTSLYTCSSAYAADFRDGDEHARATGGLYKMDGDPARQASFVIGDRLKISIFEQIRPETRDGDASRDVAASAVERTELSGEYIVQEDGNIYVPFGGSIEVAGASFHDVERTISASLGTKLNGAVRAGVQVIEREPIYVTGTVTKPGPYKHVPGMSVLHALILAGALDTASGDQWRLLEAAREKERLLKSAERLSRLLVRAELLKAERDGSVHGAMDALPAEPNAKGRVMEAMALRRLERTKREEQEAANAAALLFYGTELSIQRDKLRQVEFTVQSKTQRMEHVNRLRERGTTTDINFFQASSELGDAKERLHDARAVIAQTEHKISDIQHEKIRLSIDADVERQREIHDLQNMIGEEEITVATLRAPVSQSLGGYPSNPPSEIKSNLTILRRTPSGMYRSSAREESVLEPGDILQVGPPQSAKVVSR